MRCFYQIKSSVWCNWSEWISVNCWTYRKRLYRNPVGVCRRRASVKHRRRCDAPHAVYSSAPNSRCKKARWRRRQRELRIKAIHLPFLLFGRVAYGCLLSLLSSSNWTENNNNARPKLVVVDVVAQLNARTNDRLSVVT